MPLGQELLSELGDIPSSAAAGGVSGPSTLTVAANDDTAPALMALADRYSAARTVIRDHHIQVTVHVAADQQALAAAKPAALGDKVRSVGVIALEDLGEGFVGEVDATKREWFCSNPPATADGREQGTPLPAIDQ